MVEFEEEEVLENPYVLLVAVVGAPFVPAFLSVDDLHLLLETHLLDQLFHLLLVEVFRLIHFF